MAGIISVGGRPPQIQYPINGAAWPSGFGGGAMGGQGFGFGPSGSALLRKKLLGAGPRPGQPQLPTPTQGTGGRGEPLIPSSKPGRLPGSIPEVLGELGITPEGWVQNRMNRPGGTSFQDLQNLVDTRNRVNSMLGQRRALGYVGQGAGFGAPDDPLRKLIAQRMAANP